jgi:hypothetical protein
MHRSFLACLAALALACVALVAAPALAAPDRNATVSAAAPAYAWDGGPVTGTPVNDVDTDDTLLTVGTPGSLTVKTAAPDDTSVDIDLYLYRSNAAGDAVGDPIKMAETGSAEETITAKVGEGKYLIRVSGFVAVEGAFKGTATLTPDTGGAVTPAGATDTPPEASISKVAKAASAKKLKRFTGTARDDVSVARVGVALVSVKGGKCSQLTPSGKFAPVAKCEAPTKFLRAKGTTTWSFQLHKALKKGSYVLFARATDGTGQVQNGFGPASRKAFKVR